MSWRNILVDEVSADLAPEPATTVALSAAGLLDSLAYQAGLRRGVELANMDYREYLRTPEWRATRRVILARAFHRCERCGRQKDLEVHHLTYDRRGYENTEDLIVLCWPCHRLEHPGQKVS